MSLKLKHFFGSTIYRTHALRFIALYSVALQADTVVGCRDLGRFEARGPRLGGR